MHTYPLVTVVGGSGFVGRHLVRALSRAGYRVRVLCRDTIRAEFLKTAGGIGLIAIQHADVTQPETLAGKFEGSFAVINLVGILYASGRQKFSAVQCDGARRVAELARAAGAERFIQFSALGVDQAPDSRYASSKLAGEAAVRGAFPSATIFRPSLVIGPEDEFFQRFASLQLIAPALPLIAGGSTEFQPLLVTDLAKAVLAALDQPDSAGKTYELGGPERFTFRELLTRMGEITRRPVRFINLPARVASLFGALCEWLPLKPMLTRDQVRMLKVHSVVSLDGFAALGIRPASILPMLPVYLARFIKG